MPGNGTDHGWLAFGTVHTPKKQINSNFRRTEPSSSKCAYASAFQEGDIVKVLKEGSNQGKMVRITDAHWAGRVKVELEGVTKSYLAKELEPPTDRTSWNSVLHTVKNKSVQSRSQLKGNRRAHASQVRSNRPEKCSAAPSSNSKNDAILEHYAQQLCALSAHVPDSSPGGVLRAAAEHFLKHAATNDEGGHGVGNSSTTAMALKLRGNPQQKLPPLGTTPPTSQIEQEQTKVETMKAEPTKEGPKEGGSGKEESTAGSLQEEEWSNTLGSGPSAQVIDILDEKHSRQAEELFELLDVDEDGKIEINQAVTFINSCHGEGKQGPEAEQAIVKAYDKDHDGRLGLEEFKRVFSDIVTGQHEEKKMQHGPFSVALVLRSFTKAQPSVNLVQKEMRQRGCAVGCTTFNSLCRAFSGMCRVVTHTEIVHPESPTAFWTNLITAMLLVYSAFLIPARLGFNSEAQAGFVTHSLDYICELWFLLDVFINFHLGYVDFDTGDTIMDSHRIRKQYLRSWFVVDMLSSLPTKFLTLAVSSLARLSWIKCARILKMFRLVKLLNLKSLHDLEDSGYVRPSAVRFCKISFAFVFAVHLSSCTYWAYVRWTCNVCDISNSASASSDCPPAGAENVAWTTPTFCPPMFRVDGNGYEPSLVDSYLVAFYWSIMVMLGGDALPRTNKQYVFAVAVALVGMVVFSTIIGSLSAVITEMDALSSARQDQLDAINSFMESRRIDADLRLRIRDYYKYLWGTGHSTHLKEMFEELPDNLMLELRCTMKIGLIYSVPMFSACKANVLVELIHLLEGIVVVPDETVVEQGEPGTRMFFIVKGTFHVLHVEEEQSERSEIFLNELCHGNFFGERSLFGAGVLTATVRSVTFGELEILSFNDLMGIMEQEPELSRQIKQEALRAYRRTFETSKSARRGLHSLRQSSNTLPARAQKNRCAASKNNLKNEKSLKSAAIRGQDKMKHELKLAAHDTRRNSTAVMPEELEVEKGPAAKDLA
jgi:CRP-like cAMP-binding protein